MVLSFIVEKIFSSKLASSFWGKRGKKNMVWNHHWWECHGVDSFLDESSWCSRKNGTFIQHDFSLRGLGHRNVQWWWKMKEGYPYLVFHLQECLKTPLLTFTCYCLWMIHIHIICFKLSERLVTSTLLVAFLYLLDPWDGTDQANKENIKIFLFNTTSIFHKPQISNYIQYIQLSYQFQGEQPPAQIGLNFSNPTLPETNISHLKITTWKRGDSYWKPSFLGANC